MTTTTEELAREVKNLKTEIGQMKEIVSMIFNLVIESESEDEEDYIGYPALVSVEQPRFNT
jgi:hypothetical protein